MVTGMVVVSCAGDDGESGTAADTGAGATTTDRVADSTMIESTSTTEVDISASPDIDPCALVTDADVAALGVGQRMDTELDLDATVGSVACVWSASGDSSGTAALSLVVETPAFSDVFEAAAADPDAEDPEQIDGLGDQAAYADMLVVVDGATANWLLVRSGDVVFRLASPDRSVFGRDDMVAIAGAVTQRLG